MADIITSRSRYEAYMTCPRRGFLQYDAPNGTATPGWERKLLALPLATGIASHRIPQLVLTGTSIEEAIATTIKEYQAEVAARGLETEREARMEFVVNEQAALIEALAWGWYRTRYPKIRENYEVLSVEQEERTELAPGVILASRCDAVLRRKDDGCVFIYNLKTTSDAGEKWIQGWEVDGQVMTEMLAVERRMGIAVAGVIVEGWVKGRRMKEEYTTEWGDKVVTGYRQATPLVYGYKCEGNPPLTQTEYGYEYTRRKGWKRFAVWEEKFDTSGVGIIPDDDGLRSNPVAWWVNWLPEEVVASQFVVVPPIMRSPERIASKVRQMVGRERLLRGAIATLVASPIEQHSIIVDDLFPQNERSCIWPVKCPMFAICHESGIAEDIPGSGLYQPRRDHHAVEET